jgi:hypothetical protein
VSRATRGVPGFSRAALLPRLPLKMGMWDYFLDWLRRCAAARRSAGRAARSRRSAPRPV